MLEKKLDEATKELHEMKGKNKLSIDREEELDRKVLFLKILISLIQIELKNKIKYKSFYT